MHTCNSCPLEQQACPCCLLCCLCADRGESSEHAARALVAKLKELLEVPAHMKVDISAASSPDSNEAEDLVAKYQKFAKVRESMA